MSARSIRRARERELERGRRIVSRRSKAAIGAGTALGATIFFAPAADAATFTVTNLNDSGAGSLRQAVVDANTANGADDIVFASGLSGTIALTGGAIGVYGDSLTIQGPGAGQLTVSGGNTDRIFDLYNFDTDDEVVELSGLTLRDGNAVADAGGAIRSLDTGGDVADVTLTSSVLTGNHADIDGGAVSSLGGAMTVRDSQFTGNTADGSGGAIASYGSNADGSESFGVTIQNTVMSGNEAGDDAGATKLYGAVGDILIENSTLSTNSAVQTGGALTFYGAEDGAKMTIRNSTVSQNTAGQEGGGLTLWSTYNPGIGDPGAVLVENTTISGNQSVQQGGGIYSYNSTDTPRTIRNSTIVDNVAGNGAGTYAGGGIHAFFKDNPGFGAGSGGAVVDELILSSTIVANNTAEGAADDLADNGDTDGAFVLGFDLVEVPGTALTNEAPSGSNITGADPQLGPLADSGGPTQTRLPALTSPVIDAGVSNGLATDQRALARTFDFPATANRAGSDATDIGAAELQGASCQGTVVFADFPPTEGDDTLTGTEGPDSISALGGNDTVSTGGSNDCVSGGDGNDKASGQAGKDQIKGDAGKDNLSGGGGKDKVVGGDGKDTVKGGGGKDKLKGNAGKDVIKARGGGKDKVNCGAGKDKVKADSKDKVAKNCETVKGG